MKAIKESWSSEHEDSPIFNVYKGSLATSMGGRSFRDYALVKQYGHKYDLVHGTYRA